MRFDSPLLTGKFHFGHRGQGYTGAEIAAATATGENGPGYLYPCLSLPADNAKQVRGEIVVWPIAGVMDADEYGSFTFTDAPDGSYEFQFRLFSDGTDLGLVTDTITVGSGSHNLVGAALSQVISLSSAAATQVHVLASAQLSQTGNLSTGSLSGAHSLLGSPISQGSSLSTGAANILHNVIGAPLSVASSLSVGAISYQHNLAVSPLSVVNSLSSGNVAGAHMLTVSSFTVNCTIVEVKEIYRMYPNAGYKYP